MDRTDSPPPLVPTGTKVGWRRPALVVAAVLVGIVGLTRLGGSDGRPAVPPSPAQPTLGAVVASPPATPAATATSAPLRVGRMGGVMPRSADGLTYADGIPTGISGESVYRVRDALLVPVGRTLLVGGWYQSDACIETRAAGCPSPTLSDVPLQSSRTGDLTTTFVALDEQLPGRGARVLLATVEPDPRCSIWGAGECLPRLHVLEQIWSTGGDAG